MPLVNDSLPLDTNNTPEPTVNGNSTTSQSLNKPPSTKLKTRHSPTPPPNNLHITIDNHPIPPKKKYNILEDPVFIDSGILPPTLHPLKTPSQSNTMTDEFLRTHPNFKANLPSLYTTPTCYKFRFPPDRNFDHYVAYASKNLPQLAFWQNNRIRFFQFQFNFLKPTHHDLKFNPNDITTTLSVKKLHQTYQLFLEQKHPQNFLFQNHKFTSPFSYHSHYSLNHLFTIGTIRNYDPGKQYFNLSSYHDPTRPLFVPQEALNVNDDFLLPTHIPNAVPNFLPKMTKLVETPLGDHSRSLNTALIHKHYSLAQLNFIIAKLSSFILKKKQYKYFSLNVSDEIFQSLPKHTPPNTVSEPSQAPSSAIRPPSTSYVLPTANPNVCINSFSCPTDKFVSEILTLLRPHVEIAPNTDPFVILNHIFDTFRNLQSLLQLHSTDIQSLTLSTIHVKDLLKKLVLIETPPHFTLS